MPRDWSTNDQLAGASGDRLDGSHHPRLITARAANREKARGHQGKQVGMLRMQGGHLLRRADTTANSSSRARARSLERFTLTGNIDAIESLYRELLSGRHSLVAA